jgi:hypothetical protein
MFNNKDIITTIVNSVTLAVGATNVLINVTFSRPAVNRATSYEIVVAEDSTLTDKFAVIKYSASTPVNFSKVPADQTLK